MGAARALTAARQIKTKWWGSGRRGRAQRRGRRGWQRLGLPSSVIICMLVPLFFSWLSETSGSSLPGLANGDEAVKGRGEMVRLFKQFWKKKIKNKKSIFLLWVTLGSSGFTLRPHCCLVGDSKASLITGKAGTVTTLQRYYNSELLHG